MTTATTATTAGTVSSKVEWATVPKVNLLPPEIVENRQFARRQKVLAAVVVATVAAAGGVTFMAQRDVQAAQDELAVEQARTTTLRAEQSKYAAVPQVLAKVEAAKAAREAAMATDVPWYRFLNDLALSSPRNVWLNNLAVTVPANTAGTAPTSTDPLAPAGVGTVALTGDAADFPTVAAWLEGLDQVAGVDGTAISQASESKEKPTVEFTSSGSITPEALSHRYDRKAD